ncbi:MAG: methyltransferase domain-containing protein, partial [Promethearchaeota archaeon]
GCSGNSFLYFTDKVRKKCFFDIAIKPLIQYVSNAIFNPSCGDLTRLPFRKESFDFISALDVLEHVFNDKLAISEISRILKDRGVVLVTIPHSMKNFSKQDEIIGHYRRYELDQIVEMFKENGLKPFKTFGVYGQLMRIEKIQSKDPEKLEDNLTKLRMKYDSNLLFQKIWRVFVWIAAKVMRIDVKHQPLDKIMNIGIAFQKQ